MDEIKPSAIRQQLEQNIMTSNAPVDPVVVPPVNVTAAPAPDPIERNLIAMRKKLEEEEKARKAAEMRAKMLEEQQQKYSRPEPSAAIEEEDDSMDDPDGYVYKKNLQQTSKKITQKLKNTDQTIAELRDEVSRLKAEKEIEKRTDFNEVCSEDNMAVFARLYPDEYNSLFATQNLQVRARMAYNMVKNYGIVPAKQEVKRAENIAAVEKKIQENESKPVVSNGWATASRSNLNTFGKYDEDGRVRLTQADIERINDNMRKKRGIY